MNSDEFFQHHYKEWANKRGIYVIEQTLVSDKLGRRIFKIGMARLSLSTRIGDYRTAYSPFAPFLIHLIYEVEEDTGGKRANFALLTEQVAHATLKKQGDWSGGGEWYYNLDNIMNVIASIRQQHIRDLPNKAPSWKYYSTHISTKTVDVVPEDSISSSLKGLIVLTDEERDQKFNRGQAKVNYTASKVIPSAKQPVVNKPAKAKSNTDLKDSQGNILIHDGTKAKSYVGKRVFKFFEGTAKYKKGKYEGTVIDYFKKDSNKYPSFNIRFDDGYSIDPVSSIQLLRMLIT